MFYLCHLFMEWRHQSKLSLILLMEWNYLFPLFYDYFHNWFSLIISPFPETWLREWHSRIKDKDFIGSKKGDIEYRPVQKENAGGTVL